MRLEALDALLCELSDDLVPGATWSIAVDDRADTYRVTAFRGAQTATALVDPEALKRFAYTNRKGQVVEAIGDAVGRAAELLLKPRPAGRWRLYGRRP